MQKFLFLFTLSFFAAQNSMAAVAFIVRTPTTQAAIKRIISDNCDWIDADSVTPPGIGSGREEIGDAGGIIGNAIDQSDKVGAQLGRGVWAFTFDTYYNNPRAFLHFENIEVSRKDGSIIPLKDVNGTEIQGQTITTSAANQEAVLICLEEGEYAKAVKAKVSFENIEGSRPEVSISVFEEN